MTNNKFMLLNIQKFSDDIEAGTTIQINGSATLTDVDTSKESRVLRLLGQTNQNGTPTPSSPIPINVVSGDNEINICGKNLFDGVFRQGNISTLSNTTRVFSTQNLYLESGKSYTFSTNLNTSLYKYAVALSDTTYPVPSGFYDSGWKTTSSFTFTPSRSGYFGLGIAKSNGTDNITPNDILNFNWQLEKGSTATTYEPYIGNSYPISLGTIELCKIGDYQDYIYKDNGSWYLHKEIGKVLAKPTNANLEVNGCRFIDYSIGIPNQSYPMLYCNYFDRASDYNHAVGGTSTRGLLGINSVGIIICCVSDYTTTTEYLNLFTNNNIYVYFPLATPTNTLIEDTTLIEQLEALQST